MPRRTTINIMNVSVTILLYIMGFTRFCFAKKNTGRLLRGPRTSTEGVRLQLRVRRQGAERLLPGLPEPLIEGRAHHPRVHMAGRRRGLCRLRRPGRRCWRWRDRRRDNLEANRSDKFIDSAPRQ